MTRVVQKLGWSLVAIAASVTLPSVANAIELTYGATALEETRYLSLNLAGRSIGSEKGEETVTYLNQRLQDFGYEPTEQPFSFERAGETYDEVNIIAERSGTSGKQVIIGAHYDTAPSSATLDRSNLQGTNDNSSGVGVLLELAQRVSAYEDIRHSFKFILFGAEEVGLIGAEYYVENMSEDEIDNTIVMINLDSLIFGDKLYLNAGPSAANRSSLGRYRDIALEIAQELGIAAETNPGLNPAYPAGTGCCSDLEAFDPVVPVLAAEATNWEIGDLDGYTQTSDPRVPDGRTWHDPATDNLEFIEEIFPGLIEERTRDYTLIFDTFLGRVNSGAVSVPEPAGVVGLAIAVGLGGLFTRKQKESK
ncbi:MAG: PEP-CTERM sorting domain-containing protein [Leptolyngbyaceae cyanobacterium SL_5_9]|nr:PEP-CTERM sorting domain-containing protein [Leptolyngbyaceae cyanobacterium SL_5_9]NJO73928.1 PEP-CTERM sorting domain-containing protein [Leptolyngbyaceae cyanobacterium RM1_406_9]